MYFTALLLHFIKMYFSCILSNPTFVLHFLAHKWRIIIKTIYSTCGKQHQFLRSKFTHTQDSYKYNEKKNDKERKHTNKPITLNHTEVFLVYFNEISSTYTYTCL